MPVSLKPNLNISRKSFSLTAIFLLSPLLFFAQTLTGLWVGSLSNDSSTVRKDQSFEIALTEYRGKVYGYSRSEFIVNDTLYYIVKRVKGTIDGNTCEVTDDEIIAYNFRGKLDKGIKVTSTFLRNESDSTWYLAGTWKTNATKKYYAVTGKVDLAVEKDLSTSKLFPHLEELNLADKVAFYQERKETTPVLRIAKPEKAISELSKSPDAGDLKINEVAAVKMQPGKKRAEADPAAAAVIAETKKTEPVSATSDAANDVVSTTPEEKIDPVKKPGKDLPKSETKNVETGAVAVTTKAPPKTQANNIPVKQEELATTKPVITDTKNTVEPIKPQVVANNNTPKPSFTKEPEPGKRDIASVTPVKSNNTPAPVTEKKEIKTNEVAIPVKPDVVKADITQKAAVVEGRKSEFAQEVIFKSDSLVISLYDNGVVDGDTVSVFMNGEVIMARQGLKASAIKKTIYLTPGKDDEFTLVLFADNLGLYPPNTGLLVVRDGNDVYNLRFSADYQKNAGVVFRRKQ